MIEIEDVFAEKYKGLEWTLDGNVSTEEEFNLKFTVIRLNGVAEPTWAKIQEYKTSMQAAYDAKEYQRKRVNEYPSIADQLDDLYHNGIAGWKTTIKVTKDKFPKG